jgi:hypothetical protein
VLQAVQSLQASVDALSSWVMVAVPLLVAVVAFGLGVIGGGLWHR